VVRRQDEDDATRGAESGHPCLQRMSAELRADLKLKAYYGIATNIAPGGTPMGDPLSKGRCGMLLSFIIDSQYTHHCLC
jgi:hypothetical protein